MQYQLIMIETSNVNGKIKENKDVRIFDNIEAAKGLVEQIIIALNVNVKKKCAITCNIIKDWEITSNTTLVKNIYYEESKNINKNILWSITEIPSGFLMIH